jgi:hypothetical protein
MDFCHLHPILLEPIVEICFCRVVTLCDEPLGRSVCQQAFDFRSESIQLAFAWPFGPAKRDTLFFFEA